MTLARQERTAAPAVAVPLSYQRPVDRALVHRSAVMEVFVTDATRLDEDTFAVAVQGPRSHSYYNDHPWSPEQLDPLFLLEAARQAVTVVAHQWMGVPHGTSFLISEWTTQFTDVTAVRAGRDAPVEFAVDVTARELKRRGSRLLAATFECAFVVGGHRVGTSTVSAGYLSGDGYRAYRVKSRGDVPPMSSARGDERVGALVDPAAVGRTRAANVVLVDARATPAGAEARLDVPVRHAALYDHPLDHVPAMALLEAARQISVLADDRAPRGLYPYRFEAVFHRFVELDSPVAVRARRDGRHTTVEFHQDGAALCTVTLGVAPVASFGSFGSAAPVEDSASATGAGR
ncbi:ScbA/BarX family gamma-butyrolactone biosynthesis protein [Streptomyces sp. NPDC057245]|uniref:ScbA/BarX family gamma-butyrolactone biosynthesis protein n=1 Tax=Streptomyces sp. NPDC057245 TaxID=3346065 RepID=UPI0036269708